MAPPSLEKKKSDVVDVKKKLLVTQPENDDVLLILGFIIFLLYENSCVAHLRDLSKQYAVS